MNFPLFPHQASSIATKVDTLFIALVLLSAASLAIIFLPMFYFLFKYRRGNKANRRPLGIPTWKIEVTWTLTPLLVMLGIYSWAATVYFDQERAPADAIEINVIGKQ